MKSIFAKILLWFCVTVVICVAGSELTEHEMRIAPGKHDFYSRSIALQLDSARHAYETGGRSALESYLLRLHQHFPGNYSLLDNQGINVVTGANQQDLLADASRPPPWRSGRHRVLVAWPSQDRKYHLVIDGVLPPRPPSPVPVYLWIIAAALGLSYALAIHLASPLRSIEQVVERFGNGDLAIRADATRKDEFGNVANAFNRMADRIETLLTAERRLLQDVSHELRSPLARLEFAVELARTSRDPGKSFHRIQKEVDRLTTLVSELLQVTRAENDPGSRNLEELSLTNLVRDILDDNAVEAQARRCILQFQSTKSIDTRGDRELLRRAIENVLRNAIRYAPEGTAIHVDVIRRGSSVLITVRDFGPGVPEASLCNLFRPFFRADADRNRDSGGVGLGLSIALRAVQAHDGQMRVKNVTPGLVVEIELPLAPVHSPAMLA